MTRRAGFAIAAAIGFVLAAASIGAFAESHVRIVRLSSVEGQVQMDRVTGQGLRLAEDSEVKFSQLAMNDAGAKVNQIEVLKGIVYLDAASKGEDGFRITVGKSSLRVQRDTLMRIDATSGPVQVAVFKGDVQLENQARPVVVQKRETLTIDPANAPGYTIAKGIETVQFDPWNKEREAYSNTYAQNAGYNGPNHAFGLQDLNYYGDYTYASGYGYVWQPFGFANSMLGWNPYSNGAWMFYPGVGYSWASAYPWGWLPFHYGSWAFIKGTGWAWLPGNQYNGQWYANNFRSVPTVLKAPAGWTAATPPPINTATNPGQQTVLVGKAAPSPAYFPGGRIPPSFGSVIPGRTVAANAAPHGAIPKSGSVATDRNVIASTEGGSAMAHHGSSGHVFAAPAGRAGVSDFGFGQPSYRSGGALGATGGSAGTSPRSSSGSAAVSSSSGAHK